MQKLSKILLIVGIVICLIVFVLLRFSQNKEKQLLEGKFPHEKFLIDYHHKLTNDLTMLLNGYINEAGTINIDENNPENKSIRTRIILDNSLELDFIRLTINSYLSIHKELKIMEPWTLGSSGNDYNIFLLTDKKSLIGIEYNSIIHDLTIVSALK
jgi:hypothetical protein